MKIARIAAAALLVSCTSAPLQQQPGTQPGQSGLIAQTGAKGQTGADTGPQPGKPSLAHDSRPRPPRIRASLPAQQNPLDAVEGQVSHGRSGDSLALKVMIRRPSFQAQQLETERIHHLRAWVKGPGIPTDQPVYNLNAAYVPVGDQSAATQLRILEVPPGQFRVVTVQGYDNQSGSDYPQVPGASLKAVYHSRPDTNEHELIFSWRTTAEAEVYESLLKRLEFNSSIQAILDNLDREALSIFIETLIYGESPGEGDYANHPATIDGNRIAAYIAGNMGEIPSAATPSNWLKPLADDTLSVRDPQLTNFNHSTIQVRLTDPASQPFCISTDGSDSPPCISSTGSVPLPNLIPGTWDAIVSIDAPNGGVSTRVSVSVDVNGNASLGPIVLPPVIESLSSPSGTSGQQITIFGDGFNPVFGQNTVKFGELTAQVLSGTSTQLVVVVPAVSSGDYNVTVTSNDKTSNHVEFEAGAAITELSRYAGQVGFPVVITLSGIVLDPGQSAASQISAVSFNGTSVPAGDIEIRDVNQILVRVPTGATTGPVTVTPVGNPTLTGPTFYIGAPAITSVTDTSGTPITSAGNGSVIAIGVVNGNLINQVCFGSSCLPITANGAATITNLPNGTGEVRVTIPAGATSGPIILNTSDSQSVSTPFSILAPPTITAVTPPNTSDPNPSITLTGSHYSTVTQVTVGGVVLAPSAYTIQNDGSIVITQLPDPSNPVQGLVTVTNPAGTASSSLTYSSVVNFIGDSADGLVSNGNSSMPAKIKDFNYFCGPHGVNVDSAGYIYVADIGCNYSAPNEGFGYLNSIHRFSPDGTWEWSTGQSVQSRFSTDPGRPTTGSQDFFGKYGYVDGPIATAQIASPEDMANDAAGNIYIADTGNDAIRKIILEAGHPDYGRVVTLARLPGPEGIEITTGPNPKLYVTGNFPDNPASINEAYNTAYVLRVDDLNTIPPDLQNGAGSYNPNHSDENQRWSSNVTKVAGGLATNTPASGVVTPISAARFAHVEGLGIDGQNRIYVADVENEQIRRIDPANNQVTVFANVNGQNGNPQIYMHEIRIDRVGNVFVASPTGNPGIYLISQEGKFTLISGGTGLGVKDGDPLERATFSSPRAVDFGPDGSLYVADTTWGIRKIERFVPATGLQMP